jgi:hypothetical protein
MKFIKPNLVHSASVGNGCTPEVGESSVASLEKTPLIFSSNIHHINQSTNFVERQDCVLNLFDRFYDVDMDRKDYYDMMANADAHADDSPSESPESQAYLTKLTFTNGVSSGQEIIEPRMYA